MGLIEEDLNASDAAANMPALQRLHDHRARLVRLLQHLHLLRLRARSRLFPGHRPHAGGRGGPRPPATAPALARKAPALAQAPPPDYDRGTVAATVPPGGRRPAGSCRTAAPVRLRPNRSSG